MEPVRVGVVGLGYWGPKLVRNLVGMPEAHVRWACDLDPTAIARIRRDYPTINATTRLADILDDAEVDAVLVATPVVSHHRLGMLALDAGKHVFIEKPLATSVEEALDLVDVARRRDLLLMPGHTFLYSPSVALVRELIRDGEIGEIWSISMSRVGLGRHQLETSVAWDLGTHDFSILRYWLDEMPIDVAALSRDCVAPGTLDIAFINMRFASGCLAHVEVSWLAPSKVRRATIVGSRRFVVYDDRSRVPIRTLDYSVTFGSENGSAIDRPAYRAGAVFKPRIEPVEPLSLELRAFCRAIRRQEPLRSTPELAIDVIRWVEAVDRSLAHGGERVPLESAAAGVA